MQVRLVKKTQDGYVKDERFERKKKAIALVAGDATNINRIEKHLEAMSQAQDAYDKTVVSRPTKSQFPKKIIKKAVMEYLRKRRMQHGNAFMKLKAAELRSKEDDFSNNSNQPQGFSVFQKGFTVKDVKHIMSMIHTEEEEDSLSELHLHEKKQQMKHHLGRVLSNSNNSKWPSLHLLTGNNYGPKIGKSKSAREEMRDVIKSARKKYDKILRERRKKALEKRKQKDAFKSSSAAKAMRDEALRKDYFVAMSIIGHENS